MGVDIKNDLEENAKDFINLSIEEFIQAEEADKVNDKKKRDKYYKFSIVHLALGIELLLKRIIIEKHKYGLLTSEDDFIKYLLNNTDDTKINYTKTLDAGKLTNRINTFYKQDDLEITKNESKPFTKIRNMRNDYVHLIPKFDEYTPDAIFAKSLVTMNQILMRFIGREVSGFMEWSNWLKVSQIQKIVDSYEESSLSIKGEKVPCPYCEENLLHEHKYRDGYSDDAELIQCIKCFGCGSEIDDVFLVMIFLDEAKKSLSLVQAFINEHKLHSAYCSHCGEKAVVLNNDHNRITCIACNYALDLDRFFCKDCNDFKAVYEYKDKMEFIHCLNCDRRHDVEYYICDRCEEKAQKEGEPSELEQYTWFITYESFEYQEENGNLKQLTQKVCTSCLEHADKYAYRIIEQKHMYDYLNKGRHR